MTLPHGRAITVRATSRARAHARRPTRLHTLPSPSARSTGATVQKLGVSHVQMLGVLGIFKAKGTQVFNEIMSRPSEIVGGSVSSLLPIKCALGSQIYGTFLLNMALPPIVLAVAALIMIPTALIENSLRRRRKESATPVFKGIAGIPRCLAVHTRMRSPMDDDDIAEWRGPFFPKKRLSAIAVFLLFLLYVANRASAACALPPPSSPNVHVAHLARAVAHPSPPPPSLHTTHHAGTPPLPSPSHRSSTART